MTTVITNMPEHRLCTLVLVHWYSNTRLHSDEVVMSLLQQLYLTSLGAKTRQRLDHVGDYTGWDVSFPASLTYTL